MSTGLKIRLTRDQPVPPEELQSRIEAAAEFMVPKIVPSVTLMANTLVKLRIDQLENRVRNRLSDEAREQTIKLVEEQVPIIYKALVVQLHQSLSESLYPVLHEKVLESVWGEVLNRLEVRRRMMPWWKRWLH